MTGPHRPIIFDCDGVLVDSETIYVEVERRMLAGIGLTYPIETFQARFNGLRTADFLALLAEDYAELNQGAFPEGFFAQLDTETRARIDTELEAIAGVHDVLQRHDGPRAVASSSRADRLTVKLEKTGLSGFFGPHVYSGDLVGNGKPAPDLFLLAAEKLDLAPEDCLVIEDSAHGVTAGRAAGMTVWGFTGGGHANDHLAERLAGAGAERVVSSHTELTALLAA